MRLKELDEVLKKIMLAWRASLVEGEDEGYLADEIIELRESIGELVRQHSDAAKQSRAGSVERFEVEHLIRVGIEETINAHRLVEAMRIGVPVESRMELTVDPDRYYYEGELPPEITTGILVRAKDPDGRWDAYDIGQLTLDSLTNWLRSSGQIAPLAENTLAIVLGHDLHADDNRKGKNGRGPHEWQKEQDDDASN